MKLERCSAHANETRCARAGWPRFCTAAAAAAATQVLQELGVRNCQLRLKTFKSWACATATRWESQRNGR